MHVFARGIEEVAACVAAGRAGRGRARLSSALAVPTLAGVPVTARGVTQSFAVVSAHLAARRPRLHRRLGRPGPPRRHARAAHGRRPAPGGVRRAGRRRSRPVAPPSPSCRTPADLAGDRRDDAGRRRRRRGRRASARRRRGRRGRRPPAGGARRDRAARRRPRLQGPRVAGRRGGAAAARRRAAARAAGRGGLRRQRLAVDPRGRSPSWPPTASTTSWCCRCCSPPPRTARPTSPRRCRPAGSPTRTAAALRPPARAAPGARRRAGPPARGGGRRPGDPVRAGRRRRARPRRQRRRSRHRPAAVRGARLARVDLAFASHHRARRCPRRWAGCGLGRARVAVARYFLGPGFLPRLVEKQAPRPGPRRRRLGPARRLRRRRRPAREPLRRGPRRRRADELRRLPLPHPAAGARARWGRCRAAPHPDDEPGAGPGLSS